MALNIGELVGYVGLDASGVESGVSKVSDMLEGGSSKWGKVIGGAGAAGGALFVSTMVSGMDTEAVTDKLAASLGLSKSESARVGGVAGRLFANAYGDSMEQVSEAVGLVIRNIKGMRHASSAELEAVSGDVLNLATTFDQDLGGVTTAVGTLMKNGLAKNATEAMDLITKGMQGPANKADDLLDTFNEYPTVFRDAGLSGKDALGLMQQGLQGGARDADTVADALKEFAIRGQDASKTSAAGFKAVGLSAKQMTADVAAGGPRARKALDMTLDGLRNMHDPVKRNAAAVALFGTKAEDMGDALYKLDLDTAAKKLGKVDGATRRMGKTLNDNAKTNLTQFWRTIKSKLVEYLGGKVLPLLNDVTRFLANNVGPAIDKVASVLSGVLGPALSKVAGFMEDHAGTAKVLAGVLTGVVIAALTAWGVAATVNAAKNVAAWVSTALASGTGSAAATKSAAQVAFSWVMMGVKSLASAARIAAAWLISIGPIALVIAAVVGLAVLIVKNWDKIKHATTKVWQAVSGFLRKHWKLIVAIITGPLGMLVLFIAKHWDKIKAITSKAVGAVVGFVKSIPGRFRQGLSNLGGMLRGLFSGAMSAARSVVTNIGGSIVGWIEGIPDRIGRLAGRFARAGRGLLQQFIDGMKNAAGIIGGIAGNVWDTVKGLLNGAIDRINSALEFEISIPGPNVNVNLPDIPQLATGGRATRSTLAVIGEGREPESVLPDSVLRGLLQKAHDAGAALAKGKGGDAPLIGQVVQQPGESADQLAERVWFTTRRGY